MRWCQHFRDWCFVITYICFKLKYIYNNIYVSNSTKSSLSISFLRNTNMRTNILTKLRTNMRTKIRTKFRYFYV